MKKRDPQGARLFPTCQALARELCRSPSTLRRDLHALNFKSRVRPTRPPLSDEDCDKRVAYCKWVLKTFDEDTIKRFFFTDEKLFDTNDHGNAKEWVAPGEMVTPRHHTKWCPRVMVWGGISKSLQSLSFFPAGTKVDAQEYQKIIKPHLKKVVAKRLVFQQDGARCHIAKKTLDFLKSHKVTVLALFPARSPDLNPIEFMWSLTQRRLARFRHLPLNQAVQAAWDDIPKDVVGSLIDTYPARLRRCIELKGAFVEKKNSCFCEKLAEKGKNAKKSRPSRAT